MSTHYFHLDQGQTANVSRNQLQLSLFSTLTTAMAMG
jgi:hypothetical protein